MGHSFPEEVLEHVFSFITSHKDRNVVSLVCKSWYEIERWCRRSIFIGNCYAVSPKMMIRRFPEVRSVELKGKPHFADFNLVPDGWGGYFYPWISEMSRAYPWLEEIKLKRMVVTDEGLELISKSFKNFKVLILSSCEGFSTDGLAAIAAHCRNLKELDLRESEVEDVSGHWLSHFPETCTSLESLNMACLGSEVSFSALQRLVSRSPNLKTLRLNRTVPLEKLSTLLRRAPQLLQMGTGAYSAEPRSDLYSNLLDAFSKCKNLNELSGFWDVVPSYLPAFYPVCSRLTSLNLSYATIQSPEITKIVTQCPNLQRLWVLDYIEDTGLNALSLSCKELRELRVFPSDPFVVDANVSLTEEGLVAVSQGCRNLQSVLYFCRQMTNSALTTIARNRPNLTCFRLCILEPRAPDYLTLEPLDTGFGAIVEHCKGLERLSLSGLLTDRVFEYIGTRGKKLEMLSIAFAGDSDLGLHHVLSGCESLRKLEIRDCPFGDKALLANVSKLETMRSLWMSSCLVSLGACKLLSQKMPRLNVEVIDERGDLDSMSSSHEKEVITTRLLAIAEARKEARGIIGSHSQAMPLFISILRNGNPLAKLNVAATLTALCKDEDLRLKVLLGGCIPPLLSLLKSESTEAKKAAAEAIYEVSSGGLSEDHVGMKIFVTEGVVPTLWEQLTSKNRQDKVVVGFVTGALRNLCGDKDGYWRVTLEAGGVDIIVGLLSSNNAAIQSNAASLLARLMLAFNNSMQKIMDSGAIEALLGLLNQKNDVPVRCSAADALEALSSRSAKAKEAIVDANGVAILIGAVVAPSKECMQGEGGQILQGHATRALANICGGMSALILHLGELAQSTSVADIIGALAYTLMIFQPNLEDEPLDATKIENILVALLKPRVNNFILEAMASLYGNDCLSTSLNQSEAKKVLIGLITMASSDVQQYLITSLISLCCDEVDIWEAIRKREGIQLLISFLGLSSEEHQEYAVWLLALLTDQIDDSKWAITAAGGIPPLVHLLETGSDKAREDAAYVLWNLCCHSEDICACVESAEAIPAFLWFLKTGGTKGQEASGKALRKLIRKADPATINQLLALLWGDTPKSKAHIIEVLGHVLTMASHYELVQKGSDAYKGLRSLVQILNSSNEETQEHAASVLADLFSIRQDICDSLATDEVVHPCMKLLTSNTQIIATQSARALGALSKNKMSYIAEGDVKPLIKLAKTSSSIDAAETAVSALANLLSDSQIASEALGEDVVSALTRVLGEGSLKGKKDASRALLQLLKHFPLSDVLTNSGEFQFAVLAVVDSMNDGTDAAEALEVVSLLAKTKQNVNTTYSPWSALAEVISRLQPLVCFLAEGPASVQDKAIEVLSRLCGEKPVVVGDLLVSNLRAIGALGNRILKSTSLEVRVGGISLLICGLKEHRMETMEALDASGYLKSVVYALVDIIKQSSGCYPLEVDVRTPRGLANRTGFHDGGEFDVLDPGALLGGTAGLWLLSILSSCGEENRRIVVEAGVLEVLLDKLEKYTLNSQAEFEDNEGIWISALLLSILFQDENVVSSSLTIRIIPFLANLVKSDEILDKFFSAQAMASLVCNRNIKVNLAIANSGAVAGLTTLIGYIEANMSDLFAISDEFSLSRNPDQIVLNNLFGIEEVRNGLTGSKTIPLLVDLLRPMPDRPCAPPFAVSLLTSIADGNDANKLLIAEAGALDALTKYLSLSPQDSTESAICELLRVLYSNPDLLRYKSAVYSLNQLIAVLRLGSRCTRLNAVRALNQLFNANDLRESESALHVIQPLIDMLNAASESEQEAALLALMKLISNDTTKAATVVDFKGNPLESLCRILSSSCRIGVKTHAAAFCSVLFGNSVIRALPVACTFIEPLILLMQSDDDSAVESGVCAFEKLLDDEQAVSVAADYDVIDLLVGLISGSNDALIEASISALIKLGKDQTLRKLDMVNSGVIDNCLALLPTASSGLCSSISELFRILTNSSAISKSASAAKIVEPLFMVLNRPDFSLWGQHSALQALVNVLEKPQSLVNHKITPSQVIQPLISYIQSPSQAIQQLGTELLSHLLAQEHFQQDITTQNAVVPLVQLAGIGILSLQQTAIKALESISVTWPNAVADAGGIFELAKVIIQDDPQPSHELWESAAIVLSNVLHFDSDYYFRVPLIVLVKMLNSNVESTISVALDALIVQEKSDESSATLMTEAGAIDALLDLLRSHQCEEASGRLLEALFNHVKVRAMKLCKHAIGPLAQYLLDPQTRSVPGKLLAVLALGDLAQHEGLARVGDSVSACQALVGLLEDQSTDEMKLVTICALQNFVMYSRTNRRAVAEAGGILIIQELLLSPNLEVAGQASLLIKFLFSNHTLQEYVSNELIRSLTGALDRELWATATINEEVLKTIHVIFSNFRKLHVSEAATLCIPHLLTALKSGNEAAQDAVLNTLCLLKRSWAVMPMETSKSQLMIASEAIPILQMMIKSCPPEFHERAESLLNCLPGCLTITVKRATNLKRVIGGTNAFCRLKIGQGPSHQTKVVSRNTSPEWKEGFTWAFDVPPKGQKLHIQCLSKNTFGKTTLGEVTIQIDKVVSDGVYSGVFSLRHGHSSSNKEGSSSSRTLEIEITWSNKTSDDNITDEGPVL